MSKSVRSATLEAQANEPPLVLVVEDEFLVRLVISDALREAGYRVIEAVDADDAAAVLASGVPVNLVFSDVQMPGSMDGLGLLSLIRQTYPGLRVVITSGRLQPTLALAHAATEFLPKPYSPEKAVSLIAVELGKPR